VDGSRLRIEGGLEKSAEGMYDSMNAIGAHEILVFAPFAPRFPYETWIVPAEHGHDFGAARPSVLRDLARALQATLIRIRSLLDDPPYTLVLHSSPLGEFTHEEYHWHLELVPRPPQVLGLEWGTGPHINPVPPEDAAERLRGVQG
jgi:UDPglucose--hexose-1-phosphate uridylyltransferase